MKSSASTSKPYLPFRGVENDTSFYLPLDLAAKEIRYLLIPPGRRDDLIECRLGHSRLDGDYRIQYKALSYCWGDVSDTVEILLHLPTTKTNYASSKQAVAQPYRITRNLEAALRSLRSPHKSQTFWIDAICMNQGDPKEKTHQVGMMNLVYSKAEEVVIWLGESTPDCYPFFRFAELRENIPEALMHDLSNKFFKDKEIRRILRSSSLTYKLFPLGKMGTRRDFAISMAIRSFFHIMSLPWFRRVWVYQEIILAPRGRDALPLAVLSLKGLEISWSKLHSTISYLTLEASELEAPRESRKLLSSTSSRFMQMWINATYKRNELVFIDQFSQTSSFLASDPRDKLFALLHVGTDTHSMIAWNKFLSPNYEKPLEEVILDFSRGGIHLPLTLRTIYRYGKWESHGVQTYAVAFKGLRPKFAHRFSSFSNRMDHAQGLLQEGKERTSVLAYEKAATMNVNGGCSANVEFQFSFWYTKRPLEAGQSEPLIPGESLPSTGRHVSRVVRSLNLQTPITGSEEHLSTAARLQSFLRVLIGACRPHVVEISDAIFFTNILKMLGTEEEHLSYWLIFAKIFLTDVLDGPWPVSSETCPTQELDGLLRFRFDAHGGTIGSRRALPLNNLDSALNFPQLFLDSNGKMVLSHQHTQPGDLIATLERGSHPFIMSPVERHTGQSSPNARPLSGMANSDHIGHSQDYLFFGTCSFYPGSSIHEKA